MSKNVIIIRGWWGDINIFDKKYRKQIEGVGNNLYQKLYQNC